VLVHVLVPVKVYLHIPWMLPPENVQVLLTVIPTGTAAAMPCIGNMHVAYVAVLLSGIPTPGQGIGVKGHLWTYPALSRSIIQSFICAYTLIHILPVQISGVIAEDGRPSRLAGIWQLPTIT
jgi:hypothetical protein